MISYYKQGKFPFDKLIRVFEFDEINEAFEASHSGKAIKALLKKMCIRDRARWIPLAIQLAPCLT